MVCDSCGNCCSFGSGLVLESEIPRIASFLNIEPEKFKKDCLIETEMFNTKVFKIKPIKKADKPYGPCMLLEDNRCKIHDVKPLHCKICNCKNDDNLHTWFMVNYLVNPHDPESIRQYHAYIKTGGKVLEGAELETLFPNKQLLKDILSYERLK